MADILVLGAGYTGERAAVLLRQAGHNVVTTHRRQMEGSLAVNLPDLSPVLALPGEAWRVLWCSPLVDGIAALSGKVSRIVYLSTTGVYGDQPVVDERTLPAPATARTIARLQAEQAVQRGCWTSCILRPAAIYGPGRGAHESIRRGTWKIAGDGSNYTSRIHVEDLAAISAAAVLGDVEGAWPVADEEPSTNYEITRFCCDLLGLPLPPAASGEELDETRRANRRVDGRAIRSLLGIQLRYPSYRNGVAAALAASS